MSTKWQRRARRNRLLSETLAALEQAGAGDITPVAGGKHLKIGFTHHGRRTVLILPKNPSARVDENSRRNLRRLVAEVAP